MPQSLTLRPSGGYKWAIGLGAFGFTLLFAYHALHSWNESSPYEQGFVTIGWLLFTILTIDYFQRVYVFTPGHIRIRFLFIWTTRTIPPKLSIDEHRLNRVILHDVDTGRRVLMIPSDYYQGGRFQKELRALYSSQIESAGANKAS